jgi:ADP-ribosyl-[dinitrogen reductase] hydrolase
LNDGAADIEVDRDALARVARLRSRFRGALLGLAAGEAAAAPALYGRPGGSAPVRDLLGGGPLDLPRGAWAAHSALALASAHSLLATGRSDPEDQRARWRRWQQHGEGSATGECLGISASVARALVADRPDPALADGADALTRVAPFALRYLGDPDAMRQAVRASAAITSHRPETADAASAFADMMREALRGADPSTILAAGGHAAVPRLSYASPADGSSSEARPAAALAVVAGAFAAGSGWKDTVLRAVNLGGPADAFGALCGQLAGAHHGVEAIPAAWLAALAHRAQIEDLADALLTEVLVGLAEAA